MMKMLRIFAAWLLMAAPVYAQSQIGSGTLVGNSSAARAPATQTTPTALIDRAISSTQGAILTRNATIWTALNPGTTGLPLVSAGAGADLIYQQLAGAGIANSAITYAKIQNLGALAVMGRSANSGGVGADIQATAASDAVLRESGSTLGFGTVATGGIANNAVTLAKLATQAANTILGNATAGTAVPTALAIGSCDTATKAVQWTTNTGFACNSSITAAAVPVGGITGLGTGVATALGVNVGLAGAFVTFNGALGTPSSGTLTNATGLPLSTGVTGTLQAAQEPAHTGDVTNTAGSLAMTLAAGNAGNLNSGTLLAGRMPALTGDVTSSAGSVATTLATTLANAHTFSGVITFSNATNATSTSTGAVVISAGGLGVNNDVWIGGSLVLGASASISNPSGNLTINATAGSVILGSANANSFFLAAGGGPVGVGTSLSTACGSFCFTDTGAAYVFGQNRNTTAATAGSGFTIDGGGAKSGGSNLAGGDLTIKSGISTGSGVSKVVIQASPGVAGATSDNTRATVASFASAATTLTGTLTVTAIANVATTSALCYNTGTGLITYDGTIGTCTVSDERLKNIKGRIGDALAKLLKIEGFYYTWKEASLGSGLQIGVGAQTVERVFPELVNTDSKGIKSADYQRLVAPIIEALREVDNRLEMLERQTAR